MAVVPIRQEPKTTIQERKVKHDNKQVLLKEFHIVILNPNHTIYLSTHKNWGLTIHL